MSSCRNVAAREKLDGLTRRQKERKEAFRRMRRIIWPLWAYAGGGIQN